MQFNLLIVTITSNMHAIIAKLLEYLFVEEIESLSFALYGKRKTPGKEKFYGIGQ